MSAVEHERVRLHDGLNGEQLSQLSLDCMADEQTFGELQRFYGLHADILESFTDDIRQYRESDALQKRRQADYDGLHKYVSQASGLALGGLVSSSEVLRTAIMAAGIKNRECREGVKAEHEKLLEGARQIAGGLVNYYGERLPEVEHVRINGIVYGLKEYNVLTKREKEGRKETITIFGYEEDRARITRLVYNPRPGKTTPIIAHASTDDWQALVDGMALAAKF